MTERSRPMPVISRVEALEPFIIRAVWARGQRSGRTDLVDLAPAICSFRFYRPVRLDPDLFRAVEVRDDGHAIGWGDAGAELEMPATEVERLAEESMSADDLREFLRAEGMTHQQAAIALGRSRRQIENYLSGAVAIPRVVALACLGYRARREAELQAYGRSGPDARREERQSVF